MKKQSKLDEPVTKGYLTDELAEFRAGLIDQLDKRMDAKFDKVLAGQDKIIKELQDMREENAAGTLHFERLDEKVENHEKRITRLESAT